ncbi:MAG: M23 family metallopeptidase [Massilibacteroides sp.]|nr:M23 family metallopeptidase [Massilibacteroides sp.]
MADPATIGLAVKAAATALSDERLRKTIGWIIAAILSPLIIIIVLICGLLSGTADHNNTAIDLCFNGGAISDSVPENYHGYIEDIRSSFTMLDGSIAALNAEMEDGESLDPVRVKATFYSLFFGAESPPRLEHRKFAECFVAYEKRSRTITNNDGTTSEETYTVAVPIRELPVVYANIASAMGMTITAENQANASEIYYRMLYGRPAPTYGDEFDQWSNSLPLSSSPFIGVDGFCSPLGSDWKSLVTSEFGYRKDPFTGKGTGHGGIDLGAPKGTPVRAALPGIVYVVRYSTSGYGYHVMIDHGGGFVTLYAHCSELFVTEGQKVDAGAIIAEVGSTGRSTGPHLHFEVRINGEKQNPRNYLR